MDFTIKTRYFGFLLKTDGNGQIIGSYDQKAKTWTGELSVRKVLAAVVAIIGILFSSALFLTIAGIESGFLAAGLTAKLILGSIFLFSVAIFPRKKSQLAELSID